jgi:hypothetical protein
MQDLYDRMMRQMTTMFTPANPIPFQHQHRESPAINIDNQRQILDTNSLADTSITRVQHRDKKQDTRPTPTKRKLPPTIPIKTANSESEESSDHETSRSVLMDIATTQEQNDDI